MKKIFLIFVLLFVGAFTVTASPLVYKVEKEITTIEESEIALIDTAKYKSIRIVVKFFPKREGLPREADFIRLDAVEGIEEIYLIRKFYDWSEQSPVNYEMELPPSKIKVFGRGAGTYKIYVWASMN